jgi:hypothetical protein
MLGSMIGSRGTLVIKTGIAIAVGAFLGPVLTHLFMGKRVSMAQERNYTDFLAHYRSWQAANGYQYPDPALTNTWRSKAAHVFANDKNISTREQQVALENIAIKRERARRAIASPQFSYIGEGDQIVSSAETAAAGALINNLGNR